MDAFRHASSYSHLRVAVFICGSDNQRKKLARLFSVQLAHFVDATDLHMFRLVNRQGSNDSSGRHAKNN